MSVAPPERDQFAFVLPPDVDTDRPPDVWELVIGERRFSPLSPLPDSEDPSYRLRVPGVGEPYTDDHRSGWLVFDLPTVDADEGALQREGTRFPIPLAALPLFAAAPDFAVRSVTVPDSVSPDEEVRVSVEVTNRGDRDGTFLAVMEEPGLPTAVDVTVPAGDTTSKTVWLENAHDAGDPISFKFVHTGGFTWYEVPVEPDG